METPAFHYYNNDIKRDKTQQNSHKKKPLLRVSRGRFYKRAFSGYKKNVQYWTDFLCLTD